MGKIVLAILLFVNIFIPIVNKDVPYLNEWSTKIFVDVGAHDENAIYASAWDYMDPEPSIVEINPDFYFEAQEGYLVDFVNYYTIEDKTYHWWSGLDYGVETCFANICYTQWADAVQIRSENLEFDIDVVVIKLEIDRNYCPTCIPGTPPGGGE